MLRDQRDDILRTIAAAAAAVARLRERLLGGTNPDEIVRGARAAQTELLGKDASLLRAVDPATAVQLMADKQRRAAWAELLRVEAEAHRAAGRAGEATAAEARATTLSSGLPNSKPS